MLQELIHNKINEIFAEYQKANNIISGDIEPEDALDLDVLEDSLNELVRRVCAKQPRVEDLTPSWYIYTDYKSEVKSVTFGSSVSKDQFFTAVSRAIAFDDCDDITVQRIFYKGKEVEYAGWQPCMKFEYKDLDGKSIWVGYFEQWDH